MQAAMILCAGLGTRLRPLTDWCAKPMVPIGDAPAVAHVADHLRASGIERLVVNVHHRPDDVRGWAVRAGASISHERELLGTAGGVARARSLLGEADVLVWNGDILSDLDPTELVAAHEAGGAAATLAVVPRVAGEGTVGLDDRGRVVRLRKESFANETRGADFVGVHLIGSGLIGGLPERGCLVGDVYLPLLRAGGHLAAYVVATSFMDVGSIAAYVEANRRWLAGRGLSSWAAPDAVISAPFSDSIIGAGARIEAPVTRCIIWPGARVTRPAQDAIVTLEGTVQLPPTRPDAEE